MFDLSALEAASRVVHAAMPPTPQYAWPVLTARTGAEVWIKHENHTPIGAFKVRGGLVYLDRLQRERPQVAGIISATRGNHGQSLAFAGRRDTVYAPIGMGSGICGLIRTRDLLDLGTEIVGVVSAAASAVALSVEADRIVTTETANTLADGMACRVPDPVAVAAIRAGAARIVRVTDEEIATAMRICWTDTHNLAEGAGAASLAALLQEREAMRGKRIGLILSGANVDLEFGLQVMRAHREPIPVAA